MKYIALIFCLLATPVFALITPDEMLQDPALEARAQKLDAELRCVKCQSENVASSNALWSQDVRKLTREMIVERRTDAEILAFFQARYGDYVLMNPPKEGANLVLWLLVPLMGLGALGGAFLFVRSKGTETRDAPEALTAEEEKELQALLKED